MIHEVVQKILLWGYLLCLSIILLLLIIGGIVDLVFLVFLRFKNLYCGYLYLKFVIEFSK